MKKRRWSKLVCTLAALVLSVTSIQIGMPEVKAGSSDIVVDNSTFEKELSPAKWNAPNGDVTVEGGKIIFPESSTGETRLITREPAKVSEYYEELFDASFTLKINTLPAGEKFVVAFAVNNAESYYEEAGNVEIVFTNDGGIKAAVRTFNESGEETVLVNAQNCGVSLRKAFSINVNASKDMKLKVTVNGKTLYNEDSPNGLEGRMGFFQSGSCAAEISSVNIVSHEYSRPENTNVVEDFESGSLNKNALTSTMTRDLGFFPAGIFVEEYNGSNVLMFRNVSQGFFGTKYQYSNFEVSFDIPYVLRKDYTDEDGNIQSPAHGNLVLGIGDESDVYSNYGYQQSGEAIVCSPDLITSFKTAGQKAELAGKGYYDPEKNEGYSVKVTVVDTQITVYVKALTAKTYDKVMEYKVGSSTPLGYVHIWSSGKSNFAIDNFKITNLDKEGQVLDLPYEASVIKPEEDWEYKPMEVVYLDEAFPEDAEASFNWAMILVYAVIAGAVIIGVCIVIATVKKHPKTKKKEVDVHEN